MFDVGFSELMVIAVVALIVIGPERLPKVARTLGHLVGRLQRYVNDVKADINREIELDELRKFKSTFEDAARDVGQTIHSEAAKTQAELDAIAQTVDPAATGGLTNSATVPEETAAAAQALPSPGQPSSPEQPASPEQPSSPEHSASGEHGQAPQKSPA